MHTFWDKTGQSYTGYYRKEHSFHCAHAFANELLDLTAPVSPTTRALSFLKGNRVTSSPFNCCYLLLCPSATSISLVKNWQQNKEKNYRNSKCVRGIFTLRRDWWERIDRTHRRRSGVDIFTGGRKWKALFVIRAFPWKLAFFLVCSELHICENIVMNWIISYSSWLIVEIRSWPLQKGPIPMENQHWEEQLTISRSISLATRTMTMSNLSRLLKLGRQPWSTITLLIQR